MYNNFFLSGASQTGKKTKNTIFRENILMVLTAFMHKTTVGDQQQQKQFSKAFKTTKPAHARQGDTPGRFGVGLNKMSGKLFKQDLSISQFRKTGKSNRRKDFLTKLSGNSTWVAARFPRSFLTKKKRKQESVAIKACIFETRETLYLQASQFE